MKYSTILSTITRFNILFDIYIKYIGSGAGKDINNKTETEKAVDIDPCMEDGVRKGIGKDIYNCQGKESCIYLRFTVYSVPMTIE